ncbi:MAG TPA: hypothetical protein DCP02_05770 [Actinobacteria bacterium]|nr:hypothetical protein [Actinomycetota bacterium]
MSAKKLSILDEFNKYINGYILRLSAFREINSRFNIKKILYPGSYCDVVPSLVFSDVVYIDSYKRTEKFFTDKIIKDYVEKHRYYMEDPAIKFHLASYNAEFYERKDNFDLLISLSAGHVSISCKKYLKKNGILLANNDHYDAARACLEKDYKLIGVFNISDSNYFYSNSDLGGFFKLKSGERFTLTEFNSLASKPPSRSLKKFIKNSDLYVFLKIS